MTFRALLYAYIFGGLTFIPLLLLAIVGLGWTLLPKAEETSGAKDSDGTKEKATPNEDDQRAIDEILAKKHEEIAEGGASGTFAVLRTYDFPAANAALTSRNAAGGGATGGTTAAGDGAAEGTKESESVYQSVYRWGLGKTSTQTGSVLRNEDAEAESTANARARRKQTPASIFYIVLRHGHLMLYDSAAQVEVRHVISLAHHSVSLSEGAALPGTAEQQEEETNILKDGELFIKRTAIVLTPIDTPSGQLQSRNTPAKPFYLFSSNCSEKEDFYHSLLYTRARPPTPEPLDHNDAIKLQSTLHSTTLTPETRALNALIGRIFLSLYHTNRAKDSIQDKIEKKIARVQKPAFIASLAVKSIDLGDSAPVLSNPRLKDLHISGDMTIACDVKYTGAVKLTIAALAKLDLGPRFKTRTVELILASSLQRLQGHVLVRIKPPPSNRLWFCFETPPEMDIKVEPVVSQRQITYTFILRQIEDRIRAVFAETLVKPNWDDVPFFDTRGQGVRGGIWRDEGGELPDAEGGAPTRADMLKERNTKTKSMPVLPGMGPETDSSATSSGSEAATKRASGHSRNASDVDAALKRRSVASLPAHSATPPSEVSSGRSTAKPPPLPLRSPSFNSSSAPSVALDESSANVEPSQGAEALPQKKWRIRAAAQQMPSRKEAVEAMREMRDKASALREHEAEGSLAGEGEFSDRPRTAEGEEMNEHDLNASDASATSPSSSQTSFAARSLKSSNRTGTDVSSTSSSSRATQNQQRKQTILAATAAATNAARNWSWNAYQNAKKNSPGRVGSIPSQQPTEGQHQPMGRGQPLPPPGTPLPGPNKGIFGGFGGSIKRKPVLPPRQSVGGEASSAYGSSSTADTRNETPAGFQDVEEHSAASAHPWESVEAVRTPMSEEFGPWRENTQDEQDLLGDEGIRVAGMDDSARKDDTPAEPVRKKAPPLPRRRPASETDPSNESVDTGERPEPPRSTADTEPVPPRDSQESVDLIDIPPAQNPEEATAKFALGVDVGEADFANAPARDSVLDAREQDTTDDSRDDDSFGKDGEIVAIPAPIDEEDELDDGEVIDTIDQDSKATGGAVDSSLDASISIPDLPDVSERDNVAAGGEPVRTPSSSEKQTKEL